MSFLTPEQQLFANEIARELGESDAVREMRSIGSRDKTPTGYEFKIRMLREILENNQGVLCDFCSEKITGHWMWNSLYLDEKPICCSCQFSSMGAINHIIWMDKRRSVYRKISKKYVKAVLKRNGLGKIEIVNALNRRKRVFC